MRALNIFPVLLGVFLMAPAESRAFELRCGSSQFSSENGGANISLGALPETFEWKNKDGQVLGNFIVRGHPLQPEIRLMSGEECSVEGDARPLYESMISDENAKAGIASWRLWVKAQGPACREDFESAGYFQPQEPGEEKIALVIHGFSQNPADMMPEISLLLDQGYNVIAPRLARHFGKDLTDLKNASAAEWEASAFESFAVARKFRAPITLVGYSLGGLLSAKIASKNAQYIDRMIAFAPAWRVKGLPQLGSLIGGASILGLSLDWSVNKNPLMKETPVACEAGQGLAPASGGNEIQSMASDFEVSNRGTYPSAMDSAFSRIPVRMIVFGTSKDEATVASDVNSICVRNANWCTYFNVPGRNHGNLPADLSAKTEGRQSIEFVMKSFLQIKRIPANDPRFGKTRRR